MSGLHLFYLILANTIGGASAPIGAWTLQTWHPATLVFWRAVASGLLLTPFITWRRYDRETWLRLLGVGVLGFAVPVLIGTFGLKQSTATEAALLTCAEPVCIVVMSALILGEGLTRSKLASIALGVGGAVLIILQGLPLVSELKATHWRGDLMLFIQGFFWGLYTIIGKPALKKVDAVSFSALTTLLCLPVLAAGLLLVPHQSAGAWPPFVLGTVMTFVGVLVWNYAMTEVSAHQIAVFVFLQPLVGVLGGVLFMGDHFTPWTGAGGALILAGVWISSR